MRRLKPLIVGDESTKTRSDDFENNFMKDLPLKK